MDDYDDYCGLSWVLDNDESTLNELDRCYTTATLREGWYD